MRAGGAHIVYWIALVYALAAAAQARVMFDVSDVGGETTAISSEAAVVERLSYNIRRTMARWLLLRADDYAHADAMELPENLGNQKGTGSGTVVRVSSYRWSKEIVPALKLAVLLDPHFTEAMVILGPHLALDFGLLDEGVRMLQRAILENRDHPLQFRYYGEIGRIYQQARKFAPAETYYIRALGTFDLLRDEALLDRYRVSVEQVDLFYQRAYVVYLTECAFRIGDFDRALWALERWENRPESNRFVRFLEQYQTDKRIARGFDPNAYLAEVSTKDRTATFAPRPDRLAKIQAKSVVRTFALEGNRWLYAKMGVLALVPVLFLAYAFTYGLLGRRSLWAY